jgi:hypothetical protein
VKVGTPKGKVVQLVRGNAESKCKYCGKSSKSKATPQTKTIKKSGKKI